MDADYEKPMLGCKPCSDKLPLILSNEDDEPLIQVPASIAQYLRDYQLDGVRFLYQRFSRGEGGILGDDMGLGKTVQTIAFVAAVLQMKGTKDDKLRHCMPYIREDIAPGIELPSVNPVLLICPASLTDNWLDEFQTWGHFTAQKLTAANRLELIHRAKRKECDVVLITFELARSNMDLLNKVDWTCVIVDEVHRIKDNNSQITKSLCSLHCKIRFGLTGTPFQNNMKEVLCLLNWSNPQSMKNYNTFSNDISKAVEIGNRSSATKREVLDNKLACVKFKQLRVKYIKRRTKDILAKHLPPKTDQIVFCELTKSQSDIYKMITQLPDLQELLNCSKATDCQKNAASKKRTGLLFTYLHLLQKTANHVGLLLSGVSSQANDVTQTVCRQALENCVGLEGVPQKKWIDALSDISMSGKMLVLSQLLPVFLERKDKILIFSYSTKVLDLVQKYLNKMKYKFYRLDGTTPTSSRYPMVQSFNNSPDPSIFLLSTKAGGVGLNITGANVVILYDPNWNPAHDMQAQDRAHRLGQQREVRVYRLLSTSTIEEFVYLRQVYKQQLGSCSMTSKNVRRYFDGVSGDTRYYGELFGIRNLFSFREGGGSLTEELLVKQQQLEDKLRLKLERPAKERGFEAYVAQCAILEENKDNCDENSSKSGLAQLCQDILETPDNLVEEDPEDWPEELENQNGNYSKIENQEGNGDDGDGDEDDDDEGNGDEGDENEEVDKDHDGVGDEDDDSRSSIDTLLGKSGVVRHVIQHQDVVAPSTVEDFVAECAVNDVLHKGINSQLPAFDCTMDTQEIKEDCIPTNHSRFKFIQIARGERLTRLELATEVMAMSQQEKINLLNKYQRKYPEVSPDKTAHKRARLPDPVDEATVPNKKSVEVPCYSKALPPENAVLQEEYNIEMEESEKQDDDAPRESQEPQKPSSFEEQAKSVCPGLSREAISLVEQVICKKDRKKAPNQSVAVMQENTVKEAKLSTPKMPLVDQKDESFDEKSHYQAGGHETGCSREAVELIDSMFFSRKIRKPSPQKKNEKSLNFEASTSRSVKATLPFHERRVSSWVKHSSASGPKSPDSDCEADEPRFKAEDDVYLRLIRSGKLKKL